MKQKRWTTHQGWSVGLSMVLLLFGLPGCEDPNAEMQTIDEEPPPGQVSPPSIWDSLFGPTEDVSGTDHLIEFQLHFDVMRVEVPIDEVRHSQKIWNHVDEMQIPPSHSRTLASNGLRIGVAEVDAWPAIRVLLDAHNATSNRSQQSVQAGHPLVLDIGNCPDGERIFLYNRNGSLTSRTFDAGKQYIRVEYSSDPDEPQRVTLRVIPEIYCLGSTRVWTGTAGNYKEQAQYKGRLYKELAASLVLDEGQFLVLGSTGEADSTGNQFLLGGRFFERFDAGVRYEVLFFITPQTFRNE